MSFLINQPANVRFKVEGVITGADGAAEPFSFSLDAERLLTVAEVNDMDKAARDAEQGGSQTPITDVLVPRLRGWHDVKSADGIADVPFSPQACAALLNLPGMASLVSGRFLAACAARPR